MQQPRDRAQQRGRAAGLPAGEAADAVLAVPRESSLTSPATPRLRSPARLLLFAIAILALLVGMWEGLVRLGWALAPLRPALPAAHGPLMVAGFLSTLIGLERAVALGSWWAWAAPLLTALGTLGLLIDPDDVVAPLFFTPGSLGLAAIFAVILRRQPVLATITMALGGGAWVAGNFFWLVGAPVRVVVPLWGAFLVLTSAGERLELRRIARLSRWSEVVFRGAAVTVFSGAFLVGIAAPIRMRVVGLGMFVLALWRLRYDIARYTVKQRGPMRFLSATLLSGHGWLAISGVLWMAYGGTLTGSRYDAMLHSLFVGFVFAMIFGHAPVILPAVLGRPVPVRPAFYVHVILLHASLAVRVVGDLAGWTPLRQWGGLLNVVAVIVFLANTARAAVAGAAQS